MVRGLHVPSHAYLRVQSEREHGSKILQPGAFTPRQGRYYRVQATQLPPVPSPEEGPVQARCFHEGNIAASV